MVNEKLRKIIIKKMGKLKVMPLSGYANYKDIVVIANEILKEYSRYQPYAQAEKPDESLAELADRKGYWKTEIREMGVHWEILMWTLIRNSQNTFIIADTYAEAESKAREYLNTLSDKEAK